MKKRAISLLCCLVLVMSVLPSAALAAGSLSNFAKVQPYAAGQFTDVANEWFAQSVQAAFEYGLVNGTSVSTYSPGNNLTIAEALKLAACLHSVYNTGSASFSAGTPWYKPYVDYALTNGIIATPYPDYTVNATRADFAVIFANAMPDEALTAINTIEDNKIPDVSVTFSYGPAVYKLYRAGILTGSDSAGTYYPNSFITRDAVAAIATRMANPSFRKTLSLSEEDLSATEIAAKCSPAVFYIIVYDSAGKAFASGSGFFVNSSGLAVTNYHVIDGASSAKIQTTDNKTYDVAGVYDYNKDYDLALLQINGSGFSYLTVGDSSAVVMGETIFAIGSPQGLSNTISQGIVSNAARTFSDTDVTFIQFDAAISHGSSGGALINARGQVIGITSGFYGDGQNLNLSVPINLLQSLKQATTVPLATVAASTPILTVTPSVPAVSVVKGAQTTVSFTASSDDFDSIVYLPDNASIFTGSWGDWSGNAIPLTITGLAVGSSAVTISLIDKNSKVLATTPLNVTVTSSGTTTATTYYAGFYPVPDYGQYVGTAPNYKSTDASTGSLFLTYRVADLTVTATYAIDGYLSLLEQNGFIYDRTFNDKDGNPVLAYTNSAYRLDIFFSVATISGYKCIIVAVFPY